MLNSECSASSQRRRSATELGSFFFEPLDFHLQSANLSVQLVLINRFLRLVAPTAILKQFRGTVQKALTPAPNLRRMHSKLARQLGQRLVPLNRCQGHLGFEPCPLLEQLPCHHFHLSDRSHPNLSLQLSWSSFWGPPQLATGFDH